MASFHVLMVRHPHHVQLLKILFIWNEVDCECLGCGLAQDGAIVVVKVMHASSMSLKARQEV